MISLDIIIIILFIIVVSIIIWLNVTNVKSESKTESFIPNQDFSLNDTTNEIKYINENVIEYDNYICRRKPQQENNYDINNIVHNQNDDANKVNSSTALKFSNNCVNKAVDISETIDSTQVYHDHINSANDNIYSGVEIEDPVEYYKMMYEKMPTDFDTFAGYNEYIFPGFSEIKNTDSF